MNADCTKTLEAITENKDVRSKLKCPLFVANEMSGFKLSQPTPGRWESGNPAHFAGFPSEVGKSGL